MTESQFSDSYPTTRPVDQMTQSVYGSFDRDLRLEGLDIHPKGTGWAGMKKQISDSYPMSRYVIQYHYLLIYA
jgi:hypothetical protein